MMNLCKKSFHTILGISDGTRCLKDDDGGGDWCTKKNPSTSVHRSRSFPCLQSKTPGLSMIAAEIENSETLNVLESSAVRSPAFLCPATTATLGFQHGEVEGSSGLSHCTEGLGFESSDETEPAALAPVSGEREMVVTRRERMFLEKRSKRKMISRLRLLSDLPPTLPWLSRKGHPSFFLRAERSDGRIRLTEMKIDRQDVFLANRENGRLTLQLARKPLENRLPLTGNGTSHEEGEGDALDAEEEDEDQGECHSNDFDHHESINGGERGGSLTPHPVGSPPGDQFLRSQSKAHEEVEESNVKEGLGNLHERDEHELRDDEQRKDHKMSEN